MMSSEVHRARIEAALVRACGSGISVRGITALSGGAASMTHAVDAVRDGAPWPLICQCEASAGASLPRAAQALLIRLAALHGIKVPEVVAVLLPEDGLGDGFITARIEGEALPQKWLRSPGLANARTALTGQLAASLARLHAIPAADAAGAGLASDSPEAQRAAMYALYRSYGVDRPVFDLAFAWLKGRMPATAPGTIIHGDFRSGNFLVDDYGLTAVLDWELAHLGDRHEDLAWICVNAWRFGNWQSPVGGFADREPFYAAYEAAGGESVDRELARIFELWGTLRWGVMCLRMAYGHMTGAASSVERAAIGRRVSETEADILHILKHGSL